RVGVADRVEALAAELEDTLRLSGPEVTSQAIGLAVLERLRVIDEVAYLRFASVYKGFTDAGDFEREVGLLTKATEPKRRDESPA
ncbi:MAG: transcriptional regulator NrdR, partial [Acidimicrobiia bacterium]